ncbi:MmcQ/YjbR family DNA-binding protein [Sphingomonas panacisoli]|uniref:MmcQ/YjbR family DNA-binding protein n=2 Tax=Sphingomonas panacisoli TaxID=1813879 RepID=A0A5B8LI92_9SPHN|nr:MmcQ/YjbR family DNA-binding protein [Sphingomonas panacisoli]
MSPDYESDLARVRAICMAYPEAAEKLSHGSPAFFIEKGKVYAYVWHNHHNDGHTAVMVKTSGREEQAMLVEMDPDFYHVPPYLGPSGWIGMELNGDATDWDRIEDRIAISWEMVAPRRLLEAGGR